MTRLRWTSVAAIAASGLILGPLAFACGTDDGVGPPACSGVDCDGGSVDATLADGGADANVTDAGSDGEPVDASDASAACPGPAGTLDPTFGDGGIVWLKYPGSGASSVVVQTDGKIVVGGAVSSRTFALVRLLEDGSPDLTFGTGGLVETKVAPTFNSSLTGLALQTDGKILATGKADQEVGQRSYDFAVVRYLPNGELDQTFGSGGAVTTDFGAADFTSDSPESLILQPDGRILVGGRSGSPSDFAVARYLADGAPDPTFGVAGKTLIDVQGTADTPGVLVRLSTGKIVVAGSSLRTSPPLRTDIAAVQLNADGTVNPSFANGGRLVADLGGASSVSAGADVGGKAVLAGQVAPGDFAVLRVTGAGTLDPGFGVGGVVVTDFGGRGDDAHAVLVQSDGKLIVAGQSLGARVNDPDMGIAIARYLPGGGLDTLFGASGRALIVPPVDTTYGVSAAAISGCSIIVVGGWQYDNSTLGKSAMGIARFRR
jgi:uncharacterized delta-60 repeat protein